MIDPKRNTWFAKVKRTFTSVLPINENRRGQCFNCGDCCKLPVKCTFLVEDENEKLSCKIYKIRSLNCRKYPRSEKEHITSGEGCGYKFKK